MKKKLTFIGAFLCMMCFIGLGSANAAVAEWDRLDQPDIKDIFTGYINGLTALKDKVNISESSDMEGRPNTEILTISLENPVYGHYAMEFAYNTQDKTITYENKRNIEKAVDETQIYYTYSDEFFLTSMFYAILQDMKVGADQGINTSNWEQYGVTVTMDEKTLVYNPDETTNINIHPYKKVVFNLATADSTTTEKQNTLDQDKQKNAYLYKLNDLMSTRDPMGDCLKHKAEPTPTPVVQTKVNPKTGVALPIAAGAAVLVLALASYMVVRKKNLFRSI